MELKNKNVLVIGAAVTGIPVVEKLLKKGAKVTLNDKTLDRKALDGITFVGGGHPLELLDHCDLIIISPGVPTDIEIVQKAKAMQIPVISEIELAYRLTEGKIVAITGTNGKTTTTALLGEIIKSSGRTTHVTGNIGTPMITAADTAKKEDVFIVELSSFQLESTMTFRPNVSAILNITPDHLNRHKTMENYVDAKCKILHNQKASDYAILNLDDEETVKLMDHVKCKLLTFSHKEEVPQGAFVRDGWMYIRLDEKEEKIVEINQIFIPGKHNLENALAAALMAYCMGVNAKTIAQVLIEFQGVEHRIELVRELNHIVYYNDSKGTNPDASIKAIEAMTRPIILLAGGMDKGSEFHGLIDVFGNKVKAMVLIGETKEKIEKTAREKGFEKIYKEKQLKDAVLRCHMLAEEGDCVLLSPACASWDMFTSYEERGKQFKELVNHLK